MRWLASLSLLVCFLFLFFKIIQQDKPSLSSTRLAVLLRFCASIAAAGGRQRTAMAATGVPTLLHPGRPEREMTRQRRANMEAGT